MHGSPVRQSNTDGTDLARVGPIDTDPHARILGQAPHIADTQLGECADNQQLDRSYVVGRTQCIGHVDKRITDQLSRAVICDVAATAHTDELCPHRGGSNLDVRGEIRSRPVSEDVRMFQ